MSLIALLAAGTSTGPAESAPDPRPEPLDEVVAQIRPSGRLIWAATVAQDGTGDYTSLQAAREAAWAAWRARLTAEGLREGQATPNYRTQIIVKPGTYEVVDFRMPPWGELIGHGRDQTTLTMPTDEPRPQSYVMNLGSRFYCEGVTIFKPASTGRYAVHNASGGTTIWADVGVYSATTDTWPFLIDRRPSGLDAADGLTVLWYRCHSNGHMDSHGWDTNTVPSTHMFIGQQGGQVGFRSGSGGAGVTADETWVVGGDVHAVRCLGPNQVLHLSEDTDVRTFTTLPDGGTTDRTDWPVPYGGMSAADRARYGM